MNWPRISIVIVNLNLAKFLETAIQSVLLQKYPNLELIVVDGGSTDGSVEIINKYEDEISWWVSEPDQGQYEAIEKGFAQSSGEIMAWLNSDDRYHYRSLWEVAKIMQVFPHVKWLMGYPTEFEPGGATINRITLAWARWSKYRYLTYDFQFIMQEATFWKRELWEAAGARLDPDLTLAGDMELWARFFRHAELHTTMTLLGGFRYRGLDQKSRANVQGYIDECVTVVRRERARLPRWKRLGLSLRRVLMFPWGVFFFLDIPFFRRLYAWAYKLPPVIRYDFDLDCYVLSKRQIKHPPLFFRGRQVRRQPDPK